MLALSTEKAEGSKGLLSNLLGLKAGAKENDKFSLLLKSFSLGKNDSKDFLFAEVDAKGLKLGTLEDKGLEKFDPLFLLQDTKETKTTKLISLLSLGNEDASDEEQIHPDILKALPLKEGEQGLKTLIGEAKSYLKDQILQKLDIKELPKTLGGLIKLAEKSGIDVKAINFDSLSKTSFSKELTQALIQVKEPASLSLSTSQIVKPIPIKTDKEIKPLNALLSKANEIATPSLPVVDALEEEGATPRKILPSSITALLHGEETSESELSSKLEGVKEHEKPLGLTQVRTEALSHKITEAKQLISHMSQNVKESLENYKPPFTRIKMQLNPQKFGDMEITLIQRGSNVHININASSTALTVMMQNAHELKAQLSAHGLGDASMNFSSHQQSQQEQNQRREEAGLTYEEFQEFEEEFTEVATALEIVVPRYV
ncbi:MAG: hypothetical protein COA44_09325 [Arcobacter sp.]|nr:MAG: hypothetical protein COA44_09325 [Arcobacter sp.]